MNETFRSVIPGMLTGMITNVITGSLCTTLFIAFLTGMVAYLGQQFIKIIIKEFDKIKDDIQKLNDDECL